MTPEQFQRQFMPYAQNVSRKTGLDPRMVLAQAALETGWGQSAPNNNFFGIKSHGKTGGSNLMTKEFEGGRMVKKPQSFRGYENPEQSFQGYADFILNNPRHCRRCASGNWKTACWQHSKRANGRNIIKRGQPNGTATATAGASKLYGHSAPRSKRAGRNFAALL